MKKNFIVICLFLIIGFVFAELDKPPTCEVEPPCVNGIVKNCTCICMDGWFGPKCLDSATKPPSCFGKNCENGY
eukprot:gene875-1096_t